MSLDMPDYMGETWRAAVSMRVRLKDNESIGALALLLTGEASAFPHVKPALASAGTQKAIALSTGLEDVTIPPGYTWSLLSYWWAFSRPYKAIEYVDSQPFTSLHDQSHRPHYEHDILPYYYPYDPTGATAHTHGYTFTNISDGDMEGFFNAPFLIIEVGTDRAETKVVSCKECGAEREVDRRATKVRCENCEFITFYWPQVFGTKERAITEVLE